MVAHVTVTLATQEFIAKEGGLDRAFAFTDVTPFFIPCDSREAVDTCWEELGDGGEPHQCSWLKARFGVSWQAVPRRLMELMGDPDPARATMVTQATLQTTKIEITGLEAA